jgi:hypothetical protein
VEPGGQNSDGSVDLYFGPTKPDGVDEKRWIETLKDRAFIVEDGGIVPPKKKRQ